MACISSVCAGCNNKLTSKEFFTCATCNHKYDLVCVNVSAKHYGQMEARQKRAWKCPECRCKEPKHSNVNTPVRTNLEQKTDRESPDDIGGTDNVTRRMRRPMDSNPAEQIDLQPSSIHIQQFAKNISAELKQNLISESDKYVTEGRLRDIFRQEMSQVIKQQVTEQLKDIKEQMMNYHESFEFFNKQYEEFKTSLEEKSIVIRHLQSDNLNLLKSVKELTCQLDGMEQSLRECNVEINGIPENRSENLCSEVLRIYYPTCKNSRYSNGRRRYTTCH